MRKRMTYRKFVAMDSAVRNNDFEGFVTIASKYSKKQLSRGARELFELLARRAQKKKLHKFVGYIMKLLAADLKIQLEKNHG